MKVRMSHCGSTKDAEIPDEFWPDHLDNQMLMAIGAWCQNRSGVRWTGILMQPTTQEGAILTGWITNRISDCFYVEMLTLGGPW